MATADVPNHEPRKAFRASTAAAFAATVGIVLLLFMLRDAYRGSLGDDDIVRWFYATGLAVISGIVGVPLALRNVDLVPRWQWSIEVAVAAIAILAAVISIKLALF